MGTVKGRHAPVGAKQTCPCGAQQGAVRSVAARCVLCWCECICVTMQCQTEVADAHGKSLKALSVAKVHRHTSLERGVERNRKIAPPSKLVSNFITIINS